jgi:hypothetical protein
MPVNPSADGLRRAMRVRVITSGAQFTPRQKLLLLALNALPFFHLAVLVALVCLTPSIAAVRATAGVAWLLLAPPLLARLALGPTPSAGTVPVPSRLFFRWWATWQLQTLFNRLPWIEETLRLIPGAYSAWLRLWGARVGRLTLWSPGVRIYDRPLLVLGNDVVLGVDVRVIGHYGGLDSSGKAQLALGPVIIGDRCTVGACALLSPGLTLAADQATEALFLGTPFTHWRDGARIAPADTTSRFTDSNHL